MPHRPLGLSDTGTILQLGQRADFGNLGMWSILPSCPIGIGFNALEKRAFMEAAAFDWLGADPAR